MQCVPRDFSFSTVPCVHSAIQCDAEVYTRRCTLRLLMVLSVERVDCNVFGGHCRLSHVLRHPDVSTSLSKSLWTSSLDAPPPRASRDEELRGAGPGLAARQAPPWGPTRQAFGKGGWRRLLPTSGLWARGRHDYHPGFQSPDL